MNNLTKILLINSLISVLVCTELVMIINYQKDNLIDGTVGPFITDVESQEVVTNNIVKLIDIFKNDPIIVTKLMHPKDHVSFLSRHQAEAEESGSESLKEFLNQEIEPQTNLKIKIVYDTQSILQSLMVEEPYKIKRVALIDDDENLEEGETLIQQTLWPDNCINEDGNLGSNLPKSVNEALTNARANNKKIVKIPVNTEKNIDSVSVIKNLGGEINNDIVSLLKENKTSTIYLAGFGLDLAIFKTAIDLKTLFPDMEVFILEDASLAYGQADDLVVRQFNSKMKKYFNVIDMRYFEDDEEMLII